MVTELECAYAAGIIDGEGCISIHYRSGRHYDGSKYRFIQLRVTVVNTNLVLVHWLRDKFGFNVSGRGSAVKDPLRHKPRYAAELPSQKAATFLEAIEPHLLIKKEHATLALQVHKRIHEQWKHRLGKGHGRHAPLPPEEIAWRDQAVEMFHVLNKKGPSTPVPELKLGC